MDEANEIGDYVYVMAEAWADDSPDARYFNRDRWGRWLYGQVRRLLRHDEVVKARLLLQAVPWDLSDHPVIADLRLIVDAQLSHLDDPEAYWAMYANYRADREAIPLPQPILPEHSQFARFQAVMEHVRPGLTYLDIGSYDGAFSNRAGLLGAAAHGIDCSVTGVDLANRKAAEFNTGARHALCRFPIDPHPSGFPAAYDVVSACEIYEHVRDTVELCRALRPLVAPGGVLVLTTPHGSWLRGVEVDYHPRWDSLRAKEHVRAPTLAEVEGDLRDAGFTDVSVRSVPIQQVWQSPAIPGQATLVAVAR